MDNETNKKNNDIQTTKIIKLDNGDYVEINLKTGKKYLIL
tara:strand:- start:171 stop:290 length:120 start_codon:yes stop_codon:yes gene_type:complete